VIASGLSIRHRLYNRTTACVPRLGVQNVAVCAGATRGTVASCQKCADPKFACTFSRFFRDLLVGLHPDCNAASGSCADDRRPRQERED
jgi:hypothetical protein